MMTTKEEKKARAMVNEALYEIGKIYHPAIPVADISAALDRNGFNSSPLEGIYCGASGRVTEQIGPRSWIVLTWCKMEATGRYEIVSYVS